MLRRPQNAIKKPSGRGAVVGGAVAGGAVAGVQWQGVQEGDGLVNGGTNVELHSQVINVLDHICSITAMRM